MIDQAIKYLQMYWMDFVDDIRKRFKNFEMNEMLRGLRFEGRPGREYKPAGIKLPNLNYVAPKGCRLPVIRIPD